MTFAIFSQCVLKICFKWWINTIALFRLNFGVHWRSFLCSNEWQSKYNRDEGNRESNNLANLQIPIMLILSCRFQLHNGWPLPFFRNTHFPPQPRDGTASFHTACLSGLSLFLSKTKQITKNTFSTPNRMHEEGYIAAVVQSNADTEQQK